MPFDPRAATRSFEEAFRGAGSARRAVGEKKYLKSDLKFFGVSLPNIRKVARQYCTSNPELDRDDLLTLVNALWDTDYHELRSVGIALLERRRAVLEVRDMNVVEHLIRRSHTWAYVDWLAIKVAGSLVLDYVTAKRVLPRWSRDPYMWIRRASMLALLPSLKRDGGDFPLFSRFASAMIDEKEFFIRKAIGWVLREVSKKRPAETYRFLHAHIRSVSGLTLREGSKYLTKTQRGILSERYRSRGK